VPVPSNSGIKCAHLGETVDARGISPSPPHLRRRMLMATSLRWYLGLVEATTRWAVDDGSNPPWDSDRGFIALTWHGRQFLGHAALRAHARCSLLVAPHRDGELIGRVAQGAGYRIIRGSGTQVLSKVRRKRGAAAFREMVSHLKEERAVLMTADVPKIARVVGAGPVKLAQVSGAPIYCFAAVTRHRLELNNWDRTHVVLPFGRGAILWSRAIHVDRDAGPDQLEAMRIQVDSTLNALHDRADRLIDGMKMRCSS